ncbi:MAG: hypothetical protein AAF797_11040 [Planctomycetota bacterium]
MRRRSQDNSDSFGLSFLDVICCGFGAVILLFIMTTRITGESVVQTVEDMSAEIERVLLQLEEEQTELAEIEEEIKSERELLAKLMNDARAAEDAVEEKKDEATAAKLAEKEEVAKIARLIQEVNKVEAEIKRLEQAQQPSGEAKKNAIRDSAGTERRHYLTGLRLDGKRALILVDVSLSMLAVEQVDILRYKLASPKDKLKSRKWVRVLDSVDWMLATLEADEYQIYLYNEDVRASIPGTEGTWLKKSDNAQLQKAAEGVWNFPPIGGSNLDKAFAEIAKLQPPPDNIYILTDGLPNHSNSGVSPAMVDGRTRTHYFTHATHTLLRRQRYSGAVHTVLYPITGDPAAASRYWWLASQTKGSFFQPTPDWPN